MDNYEIYAFFVTMLILTSIVFTILSFPRLLISKRMKKYAESIKANFSKRQEGWFLRMDSSYQKFNIITGEYNGKPIEIYHYKLSFFGTGLFYHTYVNGKSYDGLLSVREINEILTSTGGDRIATDRLPKMGLSKVRMFYPW